MELPEQAFKSDGRGGTLMSCRLTPRSSAEKIAGEWDGAVRIMLNAPPVDGKANAALVKFIAKRLGVARSHLALVQGECSRNKVLNIAGIPPEDVFKELSKE